MRGAVYAGSFDPPHLGHEYIVAVANKVFDFLHIVIAPNSNKQSLLSIEQRLDLWRSIIDSRPWKNVMVIALPPGIALARYAKMKLSTNLVRGIRSGMDLEYELNLASANKALEPDVETIFLPAPSAYRHISSSMVREILQLNPYDRDLEQFVSIETARFLKGIK